MKLDWKQFPLTVVKLAIFISGQGDVDSGKNCRKSQKWNYSRSNFAIRRKSFLKNDICHPPYSSLWTFQATFNNGTEHLNEISSGTLSVPSLSCTIHDNECFIAFDCLCTRSVLDLPESRDCSLPRSTQVLHENDKNNWYVQPAIVFRKTLKFCALDGVWQTRHIGINICCRSIVFSQSKCTH